VGGGGGGKRRDSKSKTSPLNGGKKKIGQELGDCTNFAFRKGETEKKKKKIQKGAGWWGKSALTKKGASKK